jgi:DNA/RNA endonuclease YhcR with UshA esterase domain
MKNKSGKKSKTTDESQIELNKSGNEMTEKAATVKTEGDRSAPGIADVGDREVVCPSCFRFTGTYEKCPYCGAMVFKRMSVRFFRWGSLIFAFIGLFLLWLAARGIEAPVVKANSLEASMSMGFVRVIGKITNEPVLHPEWRSLYLRVDDGSGEVSVNAFSEIAVQVMDKMTLSKGDTISVKGMVRFKGKVPKPTLLLQSPGHIEIIKKAAPYVPAKAVSMEIADVKESMKGKKIVVTGLLSRSGVLDFGAYRGVLEDNGASIIVWVDGNKWKTFLPSAKALLVEGSELTVRGYVETYFDKTDQKVIMEIVPDGYDGCIKPAGAGNADSVKDASSAKSVVAPSIKTRVKGSIDPAVDEDSVQPMVTPGTGGN